ncbi:unnamed protein product [Closterium sp. NIES-64]|nr:unnamed protein product [Closterium sp. NIES-64]CAI5976951.1 unnamed protein product [Closterium sp. NIES-64]
MELYHHNCDVANPHAVDGRASMAAAKLVSDTIKGCHMDAMNKLQGLVRVWMEQDERIVRERMAQSAAAAQARTTATPPDNT